MKPTTEYYYFKNGSNMIRLAKFIQSQVYWGYHFDTKDEPDIHYKYLWDYIEDAEANGYKCIAINEMNNYVKFFK